jgi:hypothetical protein
MLPADVVLGGLGDDEPGSPLIDGVGCVEIFGDLALTADLEGTGECKGTLASAAVEDHDFDLVWGRGLGHGDVSLSWR